MPELEDLDLSKSLVTDAGLAHLAALKKLDFLDLSDTQITGEGLGALASTPITRLDLTRATITDDGLASLAHLHTLEMLWLNETAITDEGLARLVGLGSLEQLDISDTAVTDAGLEHLLALPSEFLIVYARRTTVTEPSVDSWLEVEGRILHIESEQAEAETEAEMTQQRADYYFTQTAERFDELCADEQNPTAEGDLNEALRRMMIARECELDPSNPRSRGIWQLGSAGYIWRCAETVVRPRGEDEQISAVVEKSLDTDLDRAAALTLAGVACLKEGVLLGDGSPGGLIFGQQFLERGRIYVTESVADDVAALSEEDILFSFYFGVALCDVEPLV